MSRTEAVIDPYKIVFENPPEQRHFSGFIGGEWAKRLSVLKDNPNKWARVFGPVEKTKTGSVATNISKGGYKDINKGEYEAVTRTLEDGQGAVYARYVNA